MVSKSLRSNNLILSKLLLVLVAALWGFSFVVMKDTISRVPVSWLLAFRFLISAALTFVCFGGPKLLKARPKTIVTGLLLGLFGWLGYEFQTVGLLFTTPGKNAFVTACYCIIVPFWGWLLYRHRPSRHHILACVVSIVGLGLVALDNGFPINLGDALTLGCAFMFALQIAILGSGEKQGEVWALTFWEFLLMGLASAALSAFSEQAPAVLEFSAQTWVALIFLSVVCSFVCFAGCNYAYTRVEPTAAALLSALESPFGVMFSVLLIAEPVSLRLFIGFILIFVGIVISEAGSKLFTRRAHS